MIIKYFFVFFFLNFNIVNSNEVNVYSSRHYDSDFKLYKKFTNNTGIKVNIVSGKPKALEKRILEEGKNSKADIFFVADAGQLYSTQKKGAFQKFSSYLIRNKVPMNLRTDYWIGIAKRARIIFYDPQKIPLEKIKDLSYEDLSDPVWKGKIAIRKSSNIYNQSLVASLIENNGIEKTKAWSKGLVKNMARKPKGNDRAQLLAVASGEAELAIANTYYYALMLTGQKGFEQKKAAEKLKPLFPNQNGRGAHMNISGMGILKHAPNLTNSIKFIEFMLSEEAQKHIVNNTFEYPVIENVEPHGLLKNMGIDFKKDYITNVSSFGKWQSQALKIMTEAGWQ